MKWNAGEIIALAVAVFSTAQIIYIFWRVRVEQLTQREKMVNDTISLGIYDRPALGIGDGYIFCSLWRVSHIRERAKALGYTLFNTDLYKIINYMKHNFDPEKGITLFEIDWAIRKHASELRKTEDLLRLTDEALRAETV